MKAGAILASFAWAVIATGLVGRRAAAQGRAPLPTEHECRVLINKANANPHSEAFREAMDGRLAGCGPGGGVAIANAFRRLAMVGDTSELGRMRFTLAHDRSSAILDAALDIARDARAPLPFRVLALETALRQHIIELAFSGDLGELASHPWGRICKIWLVTGDDYSSGEALDSGALGRTVTIFRTIAGDAGESAVLRDLATCAAWELTENNGS